ncbi:uncharacterized protein [Salvelinus alpinus]|uniref:uncharacterized protein isoform X12 n=1 Tax=Salvelinus alpinus TaxID=8036 RepID=UPI0039FC57D3
MWSRNLLIASVVVFLATTISTAPVEEKEPEEIEVEDGEEELSEEEEDDDDSKSQEKNMGIGAQQATTVSKGLGLSAQPGTSFQGEAPNDASLPGHAGSSLDTSIAGPSLDPSQTGGHGSSVSHVQAPGKVVVHPGTVVVHPGTGVVHPGTGVVHPGTGVVHSDTISHGSMGQAGGSSTLIIIHEAHPQPAGGSIHTFDAAGYQTEAPTSETEIESPEYDTPESPEFNGNGHKLLIGGAVENGHAATPVVTDLFIEDTTHMDPTGAMDPLGASSHLDNTGECPGIIDQSSHDFLIGLMGGVGDPYASDIHIDISDHTGMTSQLDLIAVGSGPGPALSSSSSPGPDVPPGTYWHAFHPLPGLGDHIGLISDFTGLTDYSGPDHPYLSSSFDGSHHSAGDHAGLSDTTDHPVAVMSHTDYSSSHIDHPGNGRQSQVTDTHGGDHAVNDVHHDVTDPSGQHIVSTDVGLLDAGEHGVVSHHDDMGAVTDGVAVQHHDDVHTVSPQTDTTGAAEELVTSSHTQIDITALGVNVYSASAPGTPDSVLGFGHDTTVVAEAHSVFIQTDSPVTADAQGSTLQASSHPGVTEQTQPAVSAAEQYNPSGQGPEGAENVELEDTC